MAWHTGRRGGRDLPSPIVVGKFLFTVSMNGTAACYDAPSGKELWTEKLGGSQYSTAPTVADSLIYVLDESGGVLVIKPGPKLEIVARNKLPVKGNEIFRSAISISNGQLFIRSHQALYCIGKKK
jgi:outer membrane protein assembly factor BamB